MTCSTATVNIIYNSTFIIQKISRISIYICANRPNLKSFSQSLWIILFNCVMFINFNKISLVVLQFFHHFDRVWAKKFFKKAFFLWLMHLKSLLLTTLISSTQSFITIRLSYSYKTVSIKFKSLGEKTSIASIIFSWTIK